MHKTIINYIAVLRPRQWIKNLLVFAGLIFARRVEDVSYDLVVLICFILFCALSSGIYIINDIFDAKEDRQHPEKKKRPIASGKISVPVAAILSIFLTTLSLAGALCINFELFIVMVAYYVLHIIYILLLKHVVILDVFCIAIGFVLRAVGGAVAIRLNISSWLILCTFFVSLFIGFGKRRHEIDLLQEKAVHHRRILVEYTSYFLDQIMSVVTSATLLSYALYTVSPQTVRKFGSSNLVYTVPFVLYGILRYLYLVHQKNMGGDPTRIFLKDHSLQLNVLFWLIACIIIIYWR